MEMCCSPSLPFHLISLLLLIQLPSWASTGMGSAPEVHIQGPEEDGVRVVCTASGWFPKPQVQWRGLSGRKFLTFSEAYRQDVKELFSVEATLVVRDSSVGNVTCSILNPILGQEKAMAIFIPEPFFPQASPEKPAFIVSLTLLGLLLFGAGYFLKREHSTKVQVYQEQVNLQRAKEEDQQTKEKEQKAIGELQADLGQRKSAYLVAWKKAQLYADWRKEMFQAWSVTLDPDSAHSKLAISHERKHLTWKENCGNSDGLFSVLGLEGITSGRCHWEVEIEKGNRNEWTLGVCREDAERKSWYRECPEKGFWVVGRCEDGYHACMEPKTPLSLRQDPCRVGVFLDYSEGDVSFYNMTDGSHIFSFSEISFCGTVFPYFCFKAGDVSLTICSMASGFERLPVPVDSSSLEESLSPSEEGFSSGSGVAVDPSGVESPLLPCHLKAVSP